MGHLTNATSDLYIKPPRILFAPSFETLAPEAVSAVTYTPSFDLRAAQTDNLAQPPSTTPKTPIALASATRLRGFYSKYKEAFKLLRKKRAIDLRGALVRTATLSSEEAAALGPAVVSELAELGLISR